MKITPLNITVKELVKNYVNDGEDGVYAYDKLLTVRPPYQRSFIYEPKQRDAVIDTVLKGFPLNTMYWVKNGDHFELLDGQQRSISICQFVNNEFAIKHDGNSKYFSTFPAETQKKILDYQLFIYVCEGTDEEKLDWFRTINIAGAKLTDQELLNINYVGEWLADAKRYFSKSGCKAASYVGKYVSGKTIRQEILEQALIWASEDGDPSSYMSKHCKDKNANDLWENFKAIMTWAASVFPYKSEWKALSKLDWGRLYRTYKDNKYNAAVLEAKVNKLLQDDEIKKPANIFEYLLGGEKNEQLLQLRTFKPAELTAAYIKQKGICPICGEHFEIEEMEGDHIIPWSKGGKTEPGNLQMLCMKCNRTKSGK